MMSDTVDLLVIIGPTASGKSSAALRLAKRLGGEIICADSRTVYTGMDIGTAKPSSAERAAVPHYMLDVVEPNEQFSVPDFKERAVKIISDIQSRGKLPILVGGSGLYINSVLLDYDFSSQRESVDQAALRQLNLTELQALATAENMLVPEQIFKNPRHLAAFIARGGEATARLEKPKPGTVVVGINPAKDELVQNIGKRVQAMFRQGLMDEVQGLVQRYGWASPGLNAIGYREFQNHETEQQVVEPIIVKNTIDLAKRQLTWFKRYTFITWFDDVNTLYEFVVQSCQKG